MPNNISQKLLHLAPEGSLTLSEHLDNLALQMDKAVNTGLRGETMAGRIDGDLRRVMNSAFLNLSDYVYDCENFKKR